MARIVKDDRPSFVKRNSEKRSLSSNRSEQEFSIGSEAKKFLDSFFTSLNDAPSDICTYYQVHVGETTFSNNLNSQKNVSEATRFNKIKDFVIWGTKVDKELDKREDDEREVAYTPAEQERTVLQGTIRPVVGDHVILKQQGRHGKPYMVTNVDIAKLIDKPVYTITLSPSPTFTAESIEKNVVSVYKFIFGNIGSQRKTLLLDELYNQTQKIAETAMEINKMYVSTFYDLTYDMLRFLGNFDSKSFIGCKSLREFQNQFSVLRYGEDCNTLFVEYPFITDDDLKDYKMGPFNKILKGKLPLYGATPAPLDGTRDISFTFKNDFETRDLINEENEMMLDDPVIEDYEFKYDMLFKFFIQHRSDFSILTNFRKSDIVLTELNSRPRELRCKDVEPYIIYEPKSKILRYIIDLYIDKNYEAIVKTDILEDYTPSNNNIDDYMMLPVVLYAISDSIDRIEDDDLIVSF